MVLSVSTSLAAGGKNVTPLDTGWEYHRGSLGSTWEIWRGDKASDNVGWVPVTLPHCFNAYDACDPDTPAYRGQGWYRKRIRIANPFPQGRTLLHFEGAGQQAAVGPSLRFSPLYRLDLHS